MRRRTVEVNFKVPTTKLRHIRVFFFILNNIIHEIKDKKGRILLFFTINSFMFIYNGLKCSLQNQNDFCLHPVLYLSA